MLRAFTVEDTINFFYARPSTYQPGRRQNVSYVFASFFCIDILRLALEEREIPSILEIRLLKSNLASLVTVLKARLPMDMSNIAAKS